MGKRQDIGRAGENLAAEFLEQRGLKIVARNVRCALGEIDLVCRADSTVVFVEVRSRSSRSYGSPEESITLTKRRRLTRLARWYLQRHRLEQTPARFDVVTVRWRGEEPEVTWIANAFDACE